MLVNLSDTVKRLTDVLPKRWFADKSPNLKALLTAIATPWVGLQNLIVYTVKQTRLATATDAWLDIIANDFLGTGFVRRLGETDLAFRFRIRVSLLRDAVTRSAITAELTNLTGMMPTIFEPARCMDTGTYGTLTPGVVGPSTGLAYCQVGAWGSLMMPLQYFITATRPPTPGTAFLSGYGSTSGGYRAGSSSYFSQALWTGQVTDKDIQMALVSSIPINTIAWLRLR